MSPLVRPQVLNDAFFAAANQMRQKPVHLTHSQQVCRLYRNSLRVLLSWCIHRETYNEEAMKIRARIDKNRGAQAATAARLLQEGEDELFTYTHPDPYRIPFMPGGSKHMRYSPLPKEVCFPDGDAPADFPDYSINPDWSLCTPETGRNGVGSNLVDFGKKNME